MSAQQRVKPTVLVTGANAGVGYAICQRLLLQLVQRIPPDALPQRSVARVIAVDHASEIDIQDFANCEGITLILACRDVSKADAARTELLKLLDNEVDRIKIQRGGKDVEHAELFRKNLEVVVHRIDLASITSVFSFAREIESKYSYISHLVCNAGVASFIGFNWPLAIKQLLTEFVVAVTRPAYKLQRMGELSNDGLGYIWQSNVFGHYVLFRLLEPLLLRYKQLSSAPARVLWMSSVEANPVCYDPSDWQLVRATRPYEASKFQMDLLGGWFEQQQHSTLSSSEVKEVPIRHLLCHPGVVRTNIAVKSLNSHVLDCLMQLSFLVAHILGSSTHVITPYKSAISAVHVMLVALPFITVATSFNHPTANGHTHKYPSTQEKKKPKIVTPIKFGAEVDFWFNEYVATSEVMEWEERQDQAAELVQHCDELFRTFLEEEKEREKLRDA